MKKRKSAKQKKSPQISLDFTRLRKKNSPQITQIVADLRRRFFSKEVLVVAGLLFLAFILRLIYLSHLKVNDPSFLQPVPGTDILTYHNYTQQYFN